MYDLEKGAKTVVLPPGRYVIGDPSYHVPETQWDHVLDESGFFEQQCHSTFKKADGSIGTVVAFSTAWGDGLYNDNIGNEYGVDAGLIGIIPLDDVEHLDESLGTVIEFKSPVQCFVEGGVIVFGYIEINTDSDFADESEEDGEHFDDEY